MHNMKTILILSDFSVRAQSAAEFALYTALNIKANVVLCHALEVLESDPVVEPLSWPIGDHLTLKQEAVGDLRALALHLETLIPSYDTTSFKPEITCVVDFGRLAAVASKMVVENKVDLVVMGAHKSSSFARLLFDSHTHHILDTISCPVLLVPESLKLYDVSTITYGTDLTFNDKRVLGYLNDFADAFNSQVQILHISPKAAFEDIPNSLQSLAAAQLMKYNPKMNFISIKSDNVPKSLLEITARTHTRILALVHKRYSFFDRLFQTSVSKKLADMALVPLLIMPYSFSVDNMSDEQLEYYCYERSGTR